MHSKLILWLFVVALMASASGCHQQPATQATPVIHNMAINPEHLYRPDIDIPELFAAVQLQAVYPDQKSFVDATPKSAPQAILAEYLRAKSQPGFALKAFVDEHFEPAPALPVSVLDSQPDMQTHLIKHWPNLLRNPQKTGEYSTLLPLPHPYIVPGGRFREMFYWDSYFTIVGLLQSDQDAEALDMIDNFAYLIQQFGYIPNGNRSYFLTRSQPPFFALMLQVYAQKHGQGSVLRYLPDLEREYSYWMDGLSDIPAQAYVGQHLVVTANGDYFNRYYGVRDVPRAEAFSKESHWAEVLPEPERPLFFRNLRAACESGWDFSSRWFADGKTKTAINTMDVIPVDLTSLMYAMESTLADLYSYQGQQARAHFYLQRANKRKALLQQYHYDAQTGSYQDYNFISGAFTGHLSIAMAFPLFTGAANEAVATQVAATIRSRFLQAGGVVTTLVQSGEQWDYPNGWAPMQYVSVAGLMRYNQQPLALEIARRWLALNEKVYREDGKMMEKYNVIDLHLKAGGGNYPIQDGFGWTNGVDIALYHWVQQHK